MPFAITQNCCNDASCLSVCPVNCIHPTPDEPDFGKTELLYIDPRSCIDCGACADACPVDAITRVSRLTPDQQIYADINADYYKDKPAVAEWGAPRFPVATVNDLPPIDIAIVGTGPAACYTAQALLRVPGTNVTFYDRLPTAGGLARYGVAPDHLGTRRISEHFRGIFVHPRVTMKLGVEVGKDVDHVELARKFDSVVYAVGADKDRALEIPGIDLDGSVSARTLVGWYTGHPDVAADAIDLTGVDRVTIIGNGNVALDAARILTADPDRLDGTEIAPHALAELRRHRVREVVVLARRGPEFAAFTRSECKALVDRPGVDVVVAGPDGIVDAIDRLPLSAPASALAGATRVELGSQAHARRIVFAFGRAPAALHGSGSVQSIEVGVGEHAVELATELVLLAIGYRGTPSPGIPFDDISGTIRNVGGRITAADGTPVPGCYVVGWAKRGATGGIGDNKIDAEETVEALLADVPTRGLARPVGWYGKVSAALGDRVSRAR
ncbi:FAD-dependent oxidoreductase [Rhodococcus cercidiphylli]|jgi:ferredoxin--NADP+ reductase|uniref:ferredoxin--NADP(+) reductase n=1 Tax=Rhodococcus cercidiphylli TaxID=489916 RepID=A0ABU4AWZ4_9NOCA|nr:FAD-dependent oxidoreductase [Rhodococcus cercidiphylli]MDV6230734.1 FAD-dependent oxidoreductase [Rhodococcus cercidiphylli]